MRNIKLTLEYDGTDFVGWQTQNNGRSVQQELTRVLQQILQHDVSVHGAGRTDAGVHARGQVANFHTASSLAINSVRAALNGLLPHDVCVHEAVEVPESFHARKDAVSRTYSYHISFVPLAIGRQYQWYIGYRLDLDAMKEIAHAITGEHDFESFCKYDTQVVDFRCSVRRSEWVSVPDGLVYNVEANRFLYGMVRALVGTMVDVGRGYTAASDFPDIMAAKDRKCAGMAAPAHGLCLEAVTY